MEMSRNRPPQNNKISKISFSMKTSMGCSEQEALAGEVTFREGQDQWGEVGWGAYL